MKGLVLSLLFSSVFAVPQRVEETRQPAQQNGTELDNEMCPNTNMWFVPGDNGRCHCGSELDGLVHCDPWTKELLVLNCHCITNHRTPEHTVVPVVGSCIFNCVNTFLSSQDRLYQRAPSNCHDMNRRGTLCGQCFEGYVLPPYTYNFKCMKCDNESQNWWLYITYAFVPLTVFIVIVLVFRVNVVAPKLYIFVLAAQNIASPFLLRLFLSYIYISPHKTPLTTRISMYFIASVYGVWNLDFFRVSVLPEACINVIPLHTLALDYLVALYPMLLIGVGYIIVKLHGYGFRPFLYIWWPFHRFFARFRRHWGIQTSIMDAFVTFFILSTTKLFSVSFDMLVGTQIFTPDGNYSWYLYYDPSIKYFGSKHLPWVITAIVVLIVFITFPVSLLLCYQVKAFHKCLTVCRIRGSTMDQYVNSFQQYYKDGSNGTWDCRWFAGFYIIVRAAAFATYAVSLGEICNILLTGMFTLGAVVVLIVQPYKEECNVFNIVDVNFLLWQALFFASMAREYTSTILAVYYSDHFLSTFVLSLAPLVYIIGVVVHHLYKSFCSLRVKKSFGNVALTSLPHRLLHSDQYRGRVLISEH